MSSWSGIPALPDVVTQERVLAREDEEETRVLRFGFWSYRSRPPQVIAHAAILKQDALEPNPDLAVGIGLAVGPERASGDS